MIKTLGWLGLGLGIAGLLMPARIKRAAGVRRGNGRREPARAGRFRAGEIKVTRSITIDQPAEELYRFWRNFENLPRFMAHLKSVRELEGGRSHWVARAPIGGSVEWDAEVTDDRPNERIAWRALPGADVGNSGEVSFQGAPGNRGTVVKVTIQYEPPGGRVGAAIARLFGEEPREQVKDDLRFFKQLMETGVISTTRGQPAGRKRGTSRTFDHPTPRQTSIKPGEPAESFTHLS